ncbi:NUDIX domain-containing protein, partial [Francisella tularensis]
MIDKIGYRANVAIVLLNKQNRVVWGQRRNRTSWQFPQGGVDTG